MLQQPVQNPISDNRPTNVLWNSPSLGKIYSFLGYPWFYKTTPFLSFEGKKQGQTHLFFLVLPIFWDASKNSKKSVEWHCFEFQSN